MDHPGPDELGHHQESSLSRWRVRHVVSPGWRRTLRVWHGTDARSDGRQRCATLAALRLARGQETRRDPRGREWPGLDGSAGLSSIQEILRHDRTAFSGRVEPGLLRY